MSSLRRAPPRSWADCPPTAGAPSAEPMSGRLAVASSSNSSAAPTCRYFVIFSRPHSSADVLCRLVGEHLDAQCGGELFAPKASAARSIRAVTKITFDKQRAAPETFMKAYVRHCRRSVCGSIVMPFQLPNSGLPRLFATSTGCETRAVILERRNRTAAYLDFKEKGCLLYTSPSPRDS